MSYNIIPYEGDEEYIFLSYCHQDKEKVYSYVEQLQAEGFRIWLDLGIKPGADWPTEIAEKLAKAEAFVAFMSKSSSDSHNCRQEKNYAFKLDKKIVPILLEGIDFSPVEEMQMSTVQALVAYDNEAEDVLNKIIKLELLQNCKGAVQDRTLYTVSFKTEEGKELGLSSKYRYGQTVVFPEAPMKGPYDWQFVSGEKISEEGKCKGDAVYILNINSEKNAVQNNNDDCTEIVNAWLIPKDKKKKPIPVGKKNIVIGKSVECDYQIDGALTISRKHAIISSSGYTPFIKDISSGNASFVNGKRMEQNKNVRLFNKDILSIGGVDYRVDCIYEKKTREEIRYSVKFFDDNENELCSKKYKENEIVELPKPPEKGEDFEFYYPFQEWELIDGIFLGKNSECQGNASFKAKYSAVKQEYTIVYYLEDERSIFESKIYHYKDIVLKPQIANEISDGKKFVGWELIDGTAVDENDQCLGSARYKARFEIEKTVIANAFLVDYESKSAIPIFDEINLVFKNDEVKFCISANTSIKEPRLSIKNSIGERIFISAFDENVDAIMVNEQKIENLNEEQIFHDDIICFYGKKFRLNTNSRRKRTLTNDKKENVSEKNKVVDALVFEGKEDKLLINEYPFYIGRNGQKCWSSVKVSRNHAVIEKEKDQFFIMDFSTNGTKVNGVRLEKEKKTILNKGDKIAIADIKCEFV